MSNRKLEKLSVELYFLNNYASRYLESYRAAASLYNMKLIERVDYPLKLDLMTTVANEIIKESKKALPKNHHYVLIVSNIMLTDSTGSRIFGLTDPKEKIAIISEERLASEPALARERIMKEAAHLIGHFWGLGHCTNETCIMSYAQNLNEVDRKLPVLCKSCREDFLKVYNELIK